MKCYKCGKNFDKDDGIAGLGFICFNCTNEGNKRAERGEINPKPKKFWGLLSIVSLIFIMMGFLASADNYTIYAPGNLTINHTYDNQTFLHDIMCYENNNSIINTCDIERTLLFGETYIKQENACDIRFSCPTCDINNVPENQSYKIRWKISGDNESTTIIYLNTNETRSYPKYGNFDFEDEYEVICPEFNECPVEDNFFKPINITEEQWYWYCLEPFGEYGKTVNELTTNLQDFMTNFQKKLVEDIGVCQSSNQILSLENGELRQKVVDFDLIKQEKIKLKENYNLALTQISDLNEKTMRCENGSSFNVILNWVFGGLIIIGGIIVFLYYITIKTVDQRNRGA